MDMVKYSPGVSSGFMVQKISASSQHTWCALNCIVNGLHGRPLVFQIEISTYQ